MTKVTTTINFLPLGFALLFLCVLGIIGNALCAIILSRTRMRSTYSILTLGLTFCDAVYLITKLIRYGLLSLFVYFDLFDWYTEVFYPICGPYLRALTFTAHTGSTYFTQVVAIDRYISVCWPVKARFLCTKRRAHIGVIGVYLLSFIFNIPRWFEFHTEVQAHCSPHTNVSDLNNNLTSPSLDCTSVYRMVQSPLRGNSYYRSYYIFWGYFVIMFFIPFTCLSYFNCAIYLAIKESTRTRKEMTSHQKAETSYALMLFSVVIVFLLCSVDYLILDILSYNNISYSPFWDNLGNFLLSLNSAINFLIYCAFGKKFRKEFFHFLYEISNGRLCQNHMAASTVGSKIASNSLGPSETQLNLIVKDAVSPILHKYFMAENARFAGSQLMNEDEECAKDIAKD